MPKNKSSAQTPLRKSSGEPKAKLSARQPRTGSAAIPKNKKKPARTDVVHLHYSEPPSYLNRPIPWWVPSGTRGLLLPGGPGHPQHPSGPSFITVTMIGGSSFQGVNYTNFVPYYPGITIRQALASTGIVGFGPLGFIHSVAGIPMIGGVNVRLRYNGRVIPQTLLSLPADPGSLVGLELYYALTDAIPIPL